MLCRNDAPGGKRFIFWGLLALYVILIFCFTPHAYPLLTFLTDETKVNLNLVMSLSGISLIIYCYLVLIKTKILRTKKAGVILSFTILGYLILFAIFTKNPVERFHLFEYGVLSFFIYQALSIDLREENLFGWGMIILILISSLDEFYQTATPNRFGDLKDIFINCVSGFLGLGIISTIHRPSGNENGGK